MTHVEIPLETVEVALEALAAAHQLLAAQGASQHQDRLASLNAHLEILRAALIPVEAEPPAHIFQGFCPEESSPETLDPDCPACQLLLPKRGGGQ